MTTSTQTIQNGYKQTEIGVIPADWEIKQLGDVGEIRMCRRIFNHQTKEKGAIPFYKIGTFGNEADAYIPEDLYDNYRRRFSFPKMGDVLISAAGTIGRTIVYDGRPAYFQDSNIIWIDNNEKSISNSYLYYVLQIAKYNTEGGTIQRLYNNILNSTKFICPLKPEQSAIATTLSDTDSLIAKLEKLIEKKKNIKQGAMQELLTGKRRLPGFSGKWETKKLGEVAEFDHGRDLPKSDLSEDGPYKCIHYGQLFNEYKELISGIKSRTHRNAGRFYSKANDVLIPTSDVTPRGLATASCIKEDGVILGGGILVIRLHSGYDGLYFSYFVSQNKNSVLRFVKGSTVFHLYANDLANFEVGFPEVKEQVAIASVLSDMDTEIEKLESQLTKYQNLKQGMMQSLLTGKIRLLTK